VNFSSDPASNGTAAHARPRHDYSRAERRANQQGKPEDGNAYWDDYYEMLDNKLPHGITLLAYSPISSALGPVN